MAEAPIKLIVPAELIFRDLALHTVAAACRLVGPVTTSTDLSRLDLHRPFDAEMVSAFSELFNNIVLHGHPDGLEGLIEVSMWPSEEELVIELRESGQPFDIDAVPKPKLDTLPEGGMGIHIAKSYLDTLNYISGSPNIWQLTKILKLAPFATSATPTT